MSKRLSLLVLVVFVVAGAAVLAGCGQEASTTSDDSTSATVGTTPQSTPESTSDAETLIIEDLVEGTGPAAKSGDTVSVHYTGWLVDGTKFDSSVDRGEPFTFVLGAQQVITGWDMGVAGMKVGGKRKLTIPAELGYGAQANGPIPANSTLVFEVELLEIN